MNRHDAETKQVEAFLAAGRPRYALAVLLVRRLRTVVILIGLAAPPTLGLLHPARTATDVRSMISHIAAYFPTRAD